MKYRLPDSKDQLINEFPDVDPDSRTPATVWLRNEGIIYCHDLMTHMTRKLSEAQLHIIDLEIKLRGRS
jgi:hypothetical protein